MSEAPPLLNLSGVNTHIGPYHILQGVDLAVPRGALTMLLGRNGAGKTTTLRTIMGLCILRRATILLRQMMALCRNMTPITKIMSGM